MALEIGNLPTALITQYLDKKCGFFVGSGLSTGAGFPDWKGLLLGLIGKAEDEHSMQAEHAAECRELAEDPAKFLMLAEELKEILGVDFKTYLEETFMNPDLRPKEVHDLLVALKNNNFIITTNYDLLIEKAIVKQQLYPTSYKDYESHAVQRQLYLREFFLLKAHGDATSGAEHIVLTDKDYRRLLYQQPGYQSVLQSIFTMYSVIFIGCSLQDPELRLLLNYINAAFPEGGIPHYALLSTENTSSIEQNRWRKDYNIRTIPISSDNDYEDIDIFLKILGQKEEEVNVQRRDAK